MSPSLRTSMNVTVVHARTVGLAVVLSCCVAFTTGAMAQEEMKQLRSGFIDDLPALQVNADDPDLFQWKNPEARASDYHRLMIPQPEIFLAEDNKYRGMQPDQMKLIADAIAEAIATRFEGTLELVNEPGPGVIILYMALTDLKMKKKRGVLGYTPIGAIAHGATAQKKYEHPDKLAKKINMISAKLEVEGVDGASGDRIGVHILNIAGKQKGREEKSWEALKDEINDLAERFYKNYTTKRAEEQ